MADDYAEDATPSQAALDAQLQNQNIIAAAKSQGELRLARMQVTDAIHGGADAATGRELLGRLDQVEEFPDTEDPKALYLELNKYIRSPGSAPVAPAGQAPAPSPAKKAANLNKLRKDYVDGKTDVYPG